MAVYHSTLEMIGNTPLLQVTRMDTGPCQLFLKLECQNPGGSIKDRIALNMVERAEQSGKLKPGGTIVEATAGNTGLGLAIVASLKGYKAVIVMPDKMSREKVFHLRALGAEVIMTRSDVTKGHPEYYQDLAQTVVNNLDNAYYINQFANEYNVASHYQSTAPEIWEQMDHQVDALVAGIGTGGTITGVGKFFKEHNPNIEIVLADPKGSVLTDFVNHGTLGQAASWLVEGIGEDFIPRICDMTLIDAAISVSDKESFLAARELLRQEGIMGGSSTGTLLHAALTYCRQQTQAKRVVTFVCDTGNKYLSKLYNDYWMLDQGFFEKPSHGDLRDIIRHHHAEHATVTVAPHEPLSTVHNRMRLHDVSQLPVLVNGAVVGIVDESDLLLAIYNDATGFSKPVQDIMTKNLVLVKKEASLDALLKTLKDDYVAIIMDNEKFYGIITKIDVINYLRRKAT